MKIHRFIAPTTHQALAMIREMLGPEAVIYSNRRIKGGIEVRAGVENSNLDLPEDTVIDLRELLQQKQSSVQIPLPNNESASKEELEAVVNNKLQEMQAEIKLLRDLLETQVSQSLLPKNSNLDEKQTLLANQLAQLGLNSTVCEKITKVVDLKQGFVAAWKAAKNQLQQLMPMASENIIDATGIIAMVGPTGVGKTTSVAKLATNYVLKNSAESLGLITADVNRVAGRNQLCLYANILGVKAIAVANHEELARALTQMKDKRLVMIDTAGVSQRDNLDLAEQIAFFNQQQQPIQFYLVLPATSQVKVLAETLAAFKRDNLMGCIITKVDESAELGSILSLLIEENLPLAYLSGGQRIPQDIEFVSDCDLAQMCIDVNDKTRKIKHKNKRSV